jgi:hypothetical protein
MYFSVDLRSPLSCVNQHGNTVHIPLTAGLTSLLHNLMLRGLESTLLIP